ncbi:MAG: site-specific DNA-methyltransferase [Candidatus Sericytochromatia bacterium]|nr:site-specific DNA-methyltransferase [Candidatus Sericytochromatia bacterium]
MTGEPIGAQAPTGLLIHGDNKQALETLRSTHAGRVRLVYLDPPYNTGRTFDHYDDSRDHDAWCAMMREVISAIVPLLRPDGVVVSQTDRHESAYLKVLLDEVLGRASYVSTIAVRMSATSGYKLEHAHRTLVKNTEFIHVHARNLVLHEAAYEPLDRLDAHYAYLLSADRRQFGRLTEDHEVAAMLAAAGLPPRNSSLVALHETSNLFRDWVLNRADLICRSHTAPAKALEAWKLGNLLGSTASSSSEVAPLTIRGQTYLIRRTSTGVDQLIPLSLKVRPIEVPGGRDRLALTNLLGDWWDGFHLDMGNIRLEGGVAFAKGKKPERLLRRLIRMFTMAGDLVLDPFAGSGTMAAVAHKTGRSWIAIESGPQATTHIDKRLGAIVTGEDQTGVSRAEDWRGGGSFLKVRMP